MKIKAVGPLNGAGYDIYKSWPFIPVYAQLDSGDWVFEETSKRDVGDVEKLAHPLDLADGLWFAVHEDGSTETFARDRAWEWRTQNAKSLVEQALPLAQSNPLRSLMLIRAAARLIGVDIPTLMSSMSAAQAPGETLDQVFERLRQRK